ncbi:MAG: hypothetical protein ABIJ16_10005 [Bacteroidota bacterium]
MKRIKFFILILFTATAIQMPGQNHYAGACGLIGLSNASGDNTLAYPRLSYGLSYDYSIDRHLHIGVDFLYYRIGYRSVLYSIDAEGNVTELNNLAKFQFEYYTFPIKLGLHYGKKYYGYTNAGATISLIHDATSYTPKIDENGNEYSRRPNNLLSYVPGATPGIMLEQGFGIQFKERIRVFTTLSFYRDLGKLYLQYYYLTEENVRLYALNLKIGVNYALSKKAVLKDPDENKDSVND